MHTVLHSNSPLELSGRLSLAVSILVRVHAAAFAHARSQSNYNLATYAPRHRAKSREPQVDARLSDGRNI